MSGIGTNFLSNEDSAFASGSRKKLKRKRHRNKCRNSSLRKKRLRKFHSTVKSGRYKSDIFKPRFSERIMSNWYWSNYKKAVEWQNKHQVAHWKACALALLEENRYLLQIINNMQPSMVPIVSISQQNLDQGLKFKKNSMKMKTSENLSNFPFLDNHHYIHDNINFDEDDDDDNDDDDGDGNNDSEEENDDIEFEMSEEMMEFFAQSYKHKMDLKKLEEKQLVNDMEQEIKEIQNNKIKRSTEMKFLYGDGASMITGMETAIQLSFDKYCDTKSPKYWPNIPLKL